MLDLINADLETSTFFIRFESNFWILDSIQSIAELLAEDAGIGPSANMVEDETLFKEAAGPSTTRDNVDFMEYEALLKEAPVPSAAPNNFMIFSDWILLNLFRWNVISLFVFIFC